jgi:hypothetical protein
MKKLFILFLIGLMPSLVKGQGCIAVRHMSCAVGSGPNSNTLMQPGQWQVALGMRSLHSYKHFVGTEYQAQRETEGTNVINNTHSADLGISYSVTDRLSVSANIPFTYNDRSSMYEHYGNAATGNPGRNRFETKSVGLGDARFTANYWILDPLKHPKANVMLGLGIKLPTGNSNVKDVVHRRKSDGSDYTLEKPVDQSIQLGDGAIGYNFEVQGYKVLGTKSLLYYNGFYLLSPQNVNETEQFASDRKITDLMIRYHSVADQFAARVGVAYDLIPSKGFQVMLGTRIEGIPSSDLIGGSDGFRRPGYIISIEPGISYSKSKNMFSLTMPLALVRNRIKSAYDLKDPAGLRQGDAAFADYFISATVSHRF